MKFKRHPVVSRIDVDIYEKLVFLVYWYENSEESYFRKAMKRVGMSQKDIDYTMEETKDGKEFSGRCVHLPSGNQVIIIMNEHYNDGTIDELSIVSVLGHEVQHATYFILDKVGVVFHDGGSNESFTYLQEFILMACMQKIVIKPKKHERKQRQTKAGKRKKPSRHK